MSKTILVVDDEKSIVDLIKFRLEKHDYNVLTALSGKEALEIAEEKDLDLVLLDIMMPRMDGYQVLEELRKSPKTEDTPVMFLTAKNADTDVWNGWQSGVDYYLTKPFSGESLFKAVKLCLKEEEVRAV